MSEEEHEVERDYVQPPPVPFIGQHELTLWSLYRGLLAEFVAALLLLYVSTATAIGHKKLSNDGDKCGGVGLLGVAWANGGMIFLLVYCTAGISGGYINPAVTFGLFVARKVSLIRMVMYTIAQCLGAVCGAVIVKAIMTSDYYKFGGGSDTVNDGYSTSTAIWSEILGTFILVYTVLTATDPKRNARDAHVLVLAPLPIGFVVFMIHLATIPITGTGINPARSFGAAVIYNKEKAWDDLGIFWYGPMIGSVLAAIYHEYILRASHIKAFGSFESNLTG